MGPRASRLLGGFTAIVLLTLVASACSRPAQPSEDFTDAHSRFSKLYGKSGDEAFLDPEMARIEAQLRLVPHDSLDADSARELIERIKQGRAEALKRRRELEQAAANASGQPSTPFALPDTQPSDLARRTEREEALPDRMPPQPPQEPPPPAVDNSNSPPPPQGIDSPAPPQDKEKELAQAQLAELAEQKAKKEAELAEQKAKEEAMWRGRFREATSRVTELQDQLKQKERERQLNVQGVTMFTPADCNPAERYCPPTAPKYEDKEATLRNAIQELKTKLTQAENDLAELERQASYKSIPREWRR